jgi:hypothetical protein
MTADEDRAYRAHVEVCLACRLKVQELTETLDLLPLAVAPVAPPPALKGRIMQAVAQDAKAAPARVRRWVVPVWAAAAVVALAVGSYSLVRIQTLQDRLTGFEQAASLERTVSMQGTDGAPGASGRLVLAREGSGTRIALQTEGLPPLKPGEAYQLWLIKDGKRRSGGVFVVDGLGCGGVATWFPEAVEFDALGITREPDPLGQQPRGPKMMGNSV